MREIQSNGLKQTIIVFNVLLLLFLISSQISVSAATKTYGNYTYSVADDKVTIETYTGKSSTLIIPSIIDGKPVTTIGASAFAHNDSITDVTLPSGIISIMDEAFNCCTKLKTVTLPDTLESLGAVVFQHCSSLKNITLPDSLERLSNNTFGFCSSLTEINIPSKITSIPNSCFVGCSITEIQLPDDVTAIGSGAFSGCNKLVKINSPSKLSMIGSSAFRFCSNLTSFVVPESVTTIKEYTFSDCTNLSMITFSSTVTSIGIGAFSKCSSLTEIQLPARLTQLAAFAFSECTSLNSINIPDSITTISYGCFSECSNLEEVTLTDGIITIEGEAFYNCKKLVVNIPANLTTIGSWAFRRCESLQQIILPKNLISIDYKAFSECKNVKVLEINGALSFSINETAFDDCSGIQEVTLPDNISTIPNLSGCNALKTIHISTNNPYLISEGGVVFNKDKNVLLRFPSAKDVSSYQIPATVTMINDYAFSGASFVRKVTIPDSVTILGIGIFSNSSSIEAVILPKGIKKIPEFTFYGTNLKTAVVSDKVTEIGYQAYAYCKELISIAIPASVDSLGEYYGEEIKAPFVGCDNLKKFIVNKKNKNYTSINDVLYKKDGKSKYLICYPSKKTGSSFTIPEGTIGMYSYSFYKCDNLKKLYLPKSLKGIFSYFKDCTNLKIMVPSTVTNFIGPEHLTDWPIFNDCTNCYLYVKTKSKAYQYCKENKLPYKIW